MVFKTITLDVKICTLVIIVQGMDLGIDGHKNCVKIWTVKSGTTTRIITRCITGVLFARGGTSAKEVYITPRHAMRAIRVCLEVKHYAL